VHGSFTARNFLNNVVENVFGEFSTLAMYAKASILYESAARHAMLYQSDIQGMDATLGFTESFATLALCIDRFVVALPNIVQLEMALPDAIRTIFVTHTLAHAASLRLHAIFSETNEPSRAKCLTSALTIVDLIKDIDLQKFQFMNRIIGVSTFLPWTLIFVACHF
ncbi:hypothetical protein H0H81_004413, partial [Sphagnurus paluster]